MYPHSFKEEFGSVLYYDTLLASSHYSHLIKFVHDHKHTVITMLSRRETSVGSTKRSVQALLLDGWLDYGTGHARSNIFPNI